MPPPAPTHEHALRNVAGKDYARIHEGKPFALISVKQSSKEFPDETEVAIKSEMEQLFLAGAIEPIHKANLNKGDAGRILRSIIVMQHKKDAETGKLLKVKARLVADGSQQDPGTFAEVSASTAAAASVNLALAYAAAKRMYLCTIDVKGAYLNAELGASDEPIHLRICEPAAKCLLELYPNSRGTASLTGPLWSSFIEPCTG